MTRSNRSDSPLFVTVNVTTFCNMSCEYCFLQPRSSIHMPVNDFQRVIQELSSLSLFFINISGGEPFMHPRIAEVLRIAHKEFKYVNVLSNGSILEPNHIAAIEEIIDDKGLYTTQISLDSIHSPQNALTRSDSDRTLKHIEILSKMGANIIIATVVTRHNFEEIEESILHLSEYTRYFHLMTVQDARLVDGIEERFKIENDTEMILWERMQVLAKEKNLVINTPLAYGGNRGCASGAPCMAAFSHLVIDPSLIVRPCDRLVDVNIGNLNESSIVDIWNGDSVIPFIESAVPFCRKDIEAVV